MKEFSKKEYKSLFALEMNTFFRLISNDNGNIDEFVNEVRKFAETTLKIEEERRFYELLFEDEIFLEKHFPKELSKRAKENITLNKLTAFYKLQPEYFISLFATNRLLNDSENMEKLIQKNHYTFDALLERGKANLNNFSQFVISAVTKKI